MMTAAERHAVFDHELADFLSLHLGRGGSAHVAYPRFRVVHAEVTACERPGRYSVLLVYHEDRTTPAIDRTLREVR